QGASRLVLAGVLLVGTAACASDAEPDSDQAQSTATDDATGESDDGGNGDVDVDVGDESFSVEDGEGNSMSMEASTEVPDVITDLVSLPDGFSPQGTTETTIEGGVSTMVMGTLETDDPAGVLADIETAVAAEGFETVSNSEIGGEMFTLMMVKKDEANVTVGIIDDQEDGPAEMNVTVTQMGG
ncbi:MAG: hypothetical protein WD378_05180, partial [Egicoccus sp.]